MSNQFNSVPTLTSLFKVPRENRNGRAESQLDPTKGTATSSAGAVTLHALSGTITTESLTTAAAATYTLTITNNFVNTSSIVLVSVDKASSAGTPCFVSCTPTANTATIVVQNVHSATALNAAIKINFKIIQ